MAIALDQIIPWGRLRAEYDVMFQLTTEDLSDGVLDCGGGPASFTAELSGEGVRAVAVDPLYGSSPDAIRARFEAGVAGMMERVRATPEDWAWTFHRDPDDLCVNRRTALERFLADYETGLRERRYVAGALPELPFAADSFGLAVCSHLLFLYSDLLPEAFHIRSVFEMGRVARELRLFPLLTLAGKPSPHVTPVRRALEAAGWSTDVVPVNYELQRGGNRMLKCVRVDRLV